MLWQNRKNTALIIKIFLIADFKKQESIQFVKEWYQNPVI
jgi:hypothetical protein